MKHFSRYSLVFIIGLWIAASLGHMGLVVPEYLYGKWDAFWNIFMVLSLLLVGYNAGREQNNG